MQLRLTAGVHKKSSTGKGFKPVGGFNENAENKLTPQAIREASGEVDEEELANTNPENDFEVVKKRRKNWPPKRPPKPTDQKKEEEEEKKDTPKKAIIKYPRHTCCHQCKKNPFREANLGGLVHCENDGCQKKFCKKCLKNRYELVGFGPDDDDKEVSKYLGVKEDEESGDTNESFYGSSDDEEDGSSLTVPGIKKQKEEKVKEKWHCPVCLGICNCPAHRHAQGLDAYGHVGWLRTLASEKGFASVAEFVLHLKKKESEEREDSENNSVDGKKEKKKKRKSSTTKGNSAKKGKSKKGEKSKKEKSKKGEKSRKEKPKKGEKSKKPKKGEKPKKEELETESESSEKEEEKKNPPQKAKSLPTSPTTKKRKRDESSDVEANSDSDFQIPKKGKTQK